MKYVTLRSDGVWGFVQSVAVQTIFFFCFHTFLCDKGDEAIPNRSDFNLTYLTNDP